MKISDGVCGYIAGGLGNQLFILAAAWAQAERLGAPLYLDTSHHDVSGTFAFELGGLASPAILLGKQSPWRSVRISGERVLPMPLPKAPLMRRVFFERDSTKYDATINEIKLGTTLFGYFQSERYFESIRTEVRALIEGAPETAEESDLLARFAADPKIHVHLRRGDYLKVPEERQLIATTNYALRARRLLDQLGITGALRIFSDSPELVRSEFEGIDADIEIVDKVGPLTPINTIKAMATGRALVMSNSSFSWWAGWLMQEAQGPDTVIVVPRPWNESGTAKADMLKRDWVSLDAR